MPVVRGIFHISCGGQSLGSHVLEDLHCRKVPKVEVRISDRWLFSRCSAGSRVTRGNAKRTRTRARNKREKFWLVVFLHNMKPYISKVPMKIFLQHPNASKSPYFAIILKKIKISDWWHFTDARTFFKKTRNVLISYFLSQMFL